MKHISTIFAFVALICLCHTANADIVDLPVTTVNGHTYHYYDVPGGESMFAAARKLNTSREYIIECNPQLADGMLSGNTRLYFPAQVAQATDEATVVALEESADDEAIGDVTHVVKKGETLYGISRSYGISVDDLVALNPSAREGVRPGDSLLIYSADDMLAADEEAVEDPMYSGYTESAQDVAALPVEESADIDEPTEIDEVEITEEPDMLVADAPLMDAQVPVGAVSEVKSDRRPYNPSTEDVLDLVNSRIAAGQGTVVVPSNNAGIPEQSILGSLESVLRQQQVESGLTIAVMLPLMLDVEKLSPQAEMFTEFYRGFLLAANELSRQGKHINIRAYDTAGSADTIRSLMSQPEMAGVNVFIAPDTDAQLQALINGADSDAYILNLFVPRNDAHKSRRNVIQGNLPHSEMYTRAIDALIDELNGRTPVFLTRTGGDTDKSEITAAMRRRLSDAGIGYEEITFSNSLTDADLSRLSPSGAYVFVPASSQRTEFQRISSTLKRFKSLHAEPDTVSLFGYPEWLTFRGDVAESLAELNATIYSRFYNDAESYAIKRVMKDYKYTYGREIIDVEPSQALLGYDTAMFVIRALRATDGDFHAGGTDYEGLQTSFALDDDGIAGLVNSSLLLIKFRPGAPAIVKNI